MRPDATLHRRGRRRGPRSLFAFQHRRRSRLQPEEAHDAAVSTASCVTTVFDVTAASCVTTVFDVTAASCVTTVFDVTEATLGVFGSSCASPDTASTSFPTSSVPPAGACGEAQAEPADRLTLNSISSILTILHLNIRSYIKHQAELEARLESMDQKPTIVAITESWLNPAIEHVSLSGYIMVARRDRCTCRTGGGVIVFAQENLWCVVDAGNSNDAECCWIIVHTNNGPLLIGAWYRPPNRHGRSAPFQSTNAVFADLANLAPEVVGTILVGDMNVHMSSWLYYSNGESPEGKHLHEHSLGAGLVQCVDQPTRQAYLLDLVLTDLDDIVSTSVLSEISDHKLVAISVSLDVPQGVKCWRDCWNFHAADWNGLRSCLALLDWHALLNWTDGTALVSSFTQLLLELCKGYIPHGRRDIIKSTHPWLNDACRQAVKDKCDASGTDRFRDQAIECSGILLAEFRKYQSKTRDKLRKLPRSSKAWWRFNKALMQRKEKASSIPPLRDGSAWILDGKGKAELFAKTWRAKCALPESFFELPADSDDHCEAILGNFLPLRRRVAHRFLKALKVDKATGPDQIGNQILKECAWELSLPIILIARHLLHRGEWPDDWKMHWLGAVFKKGSVQRAVNYRGIHLTTNMGKTVERCIGSLFLPFLESSGAFGIRQFAYRKKHSARDLLFILVNQWILALHQGRKVGLFLSDISGAFDRVAYERLVIKIRRAGLGNKMCNFLAAYLKPRTAKVIVEGEASDAFTIANQVFQGTVLGPPLWNLFFADVQLEVAALDAQSSVFADDLNAYKLYDADCTSSFIKEDLTIVAERIHHWGTINQVLFDPLKEHFCILHRSEYEGVPFRLLGVDFDVQLLMGDFCTDLASRCNGKLKALLRTRRFYSTSHLIGLYKTHVLSMLELPLPWES